MGGGNGVVLVSGQAKGGPSLPLGHRWWCCVPSRQQECTYTNHRIDRDGHWQQSRIQPILISVPQWPNMTCNAPTQPYRVGKKPPVKADLTIYRQVVDASEQFMSVSLTLGHNLDFSSCDILVGFCKSSHIIII